MANAPILVVDDDEAYLWYVDTVLKSAGLSAVLCTSAYAAKQELAKGAFDLVIADLMLPGSSGLEVLELSRRADPQSVGLIMTAFATVEAAVGALEKGVYDFLVKPCPAEVLVAAVRRAQEHGSLRRELARKVQACQAIKDQLAQTAAALLDVASGLERLPPAPDLGDLTRKAASLREGALHLRSRLDGLN